jgi:AraC family transcriptional regulator
VDTTYPQFLRSPFHCDGHPRISIVLQGTLQEETHTCEVAASAASVVVKPADVRHRNTFGPGGARLVSLLPPPGLLADIRLLDRWAWHHAGPVGAAALRLVRSIGQTPEEAPDDLWSFLATLSPADADARAVPDWLRRAKEHLDDAGTASPSVETLAEDAGVHPVSLARAFRRAFGCAPTAYRRHRRVRAAADLLASSRRPAAEIALDAGFSDQSHMCREVRDELGLTPSQLRGLPGCV